MKCYVRKKEIEIGKSISQIREEEQEAKNNIFLNMNLYTSPGVEVNNNTEISTFNPNTQNNMNVMNITSANNTTNLNYNVPNNFISTNLNDLNNSNKPNENSRALILSPGQKFVLVLLTLFGMLLQPFYILCYCIIGTIYIFQNVFCCSSSHS